MSVSHRYRNFGGPKGSAASDDDETSEAIEDQKLQAFEAGYQAGWDDALKAKSEEKEKITAEIGQNLLDMSFTYHEALSKLTLSIEPIMGQIVHKLLPEMVNAALGAHIVEQISLLLKEQVGGPVEIIVSPKNKTLVEEMIGEHLSEPFKVEGEENLAEGQAYVRIADVERQIDLDKVIEEVTTALNGFFHEAEGHETDG